ncbi:MAG: hypothetical protein ABWZ40_15080 [Caulobacterales bacterium]
MGLARTSDDRPLNGIGFCSALIFNISLVALAISGAFLAAEYARPNLYSYEISDASLAQTRASIDAAASALPAGRSDRRGYWGSLVNAALERSDVDCAKGYLLLAPEMLPAEDGASLNLALSKPSTEKTKARSADDRLIQAAALLLPKQARAAWTEATAPPDPVDDFLSNPIQSLMNMANDALTPDIAPPPDPFELEEGYAIADMAQRTLNNQPVDVFKFKLTAFAQYLPGSDIVESGDGSAIRNAASVVLGARAQKRLPAGIADVLIQRLNATFPDQDLRARLVDANAIPTAKDDPLVFATGVKTAFQKTARRDAADDVISLLKRINAVANATSQKGAAQLLAYAGNDEDMARLQLVAQAGGLRAVALSDQMHAQVLDLARGTVRTRGKLDAGKALIGISLLGAFSAFCFTMFQALGRFMEKRNREGLAFSDSFWPQP